MMNKLVDCKGKIKSVLFGVAVGDALGLPVKFKSRECFKLNPVCEMIGYGTFKLPPGTWSDDSSLTFCLAEALVGSFDLRRLANYFMDWYYQGYWTPYGKAFDIGLTTGEAITRLSQGTFPEFAGGVDEFSNGNGSLMRICPMVFYLANKPIDERFEMTRKVSSITHRHIRSIIACFYYLEFAMMLLDSKDKFAIYKEMQNKVPDFLNLIDVDSEEIAKFNRLLKENIYEQPEDKISSSAYVVDTLEASIWCLLTTNNFKEAVLKAVNLGEDSDTTAAVTGGLAGLLYGYKSIPKEWVNQLARKEDIEYLALRLANKINRMLK